jgi:hypothetical protein
MNVINIIIFAIGLAGAAGVLAAYFYQSRAKTVIELQQAEISAKDGAIARLEAEALKSKAEREALELRIKAFEKLPDYTKISNQITRQHKEVMTILAGIMKMTAGK